MANNTPTPEDIDAKLEARKQKRKNDLRKAALKHWNKIKDQYTTIRVTKETQQRFKELSEAQDLKFEELLNKLMDAF